MTLEGSPETVPAVAPAPRRGPLFFAPLLAGVSIVLAGAMPLFAPVLLPLAASRLVRAALGWIAGAGAGASDLARRILAGLALPLAALLPLGLLLLVSPKAAVVDSFVLGLTFVTLPALGFVAGVLHSVSRDRLVLLAGALAGVGALAWILGVTLATGEPAGSLVARTFAAAVPDTIATYRAAGVPESTLAAMNRAFALGQRAFELQLPGIALSGCAVFGALLVYPFAPVAFLGTDGTLAGASFSRFRTPLAAVVVFVPAGLLAALAPSPWRQPAVDVLLPLAVLFFLRGLAIIRALLDRGRLGLFVRAIVYYLVFQIPLVPLVLALGGLFDEFLDFRGRLERAAEGPLDPP